MATQTESVVTPERFQQGIGWKEWMEQIDRNQDKFTESYEQATLNPDDVARIKALMAKPNGPAKVLALGEAWCPDVFRGLPVIQRLCEATGLELKIFFRDQNLDIMNEFLYKDEFQSIPVAVFYTKDHAYIDNWIERAQKARDEAPILREVTAKMREPDLTPEQREEAMAAYVAFQRGPIWDGWRQAQVTEIRELLEEHCR